MSKLCTLKDFEAFFMTGGFIGVHFMMFAMLKNASRCDVRAVIFFYIRKLTVHLSKFASRTMLELTAEEMTWKSIMWHLEVMISNEQL